MSSVPTIGKIARKWADASQTGKGLRLSAGELDLLNAAGAGLLVMNAVAADQKAAAVGRLEARTPSDPQ